MDNNAIQTAASMFQNLKQGLGNTGYAIGQGLQGISNAFAAPPPSPPTHVPSSNPQDMKLTMVPTGQLSASTPPPQPAQPVAVSQPDDQMATNIKQGIMNWGGNTPLLNHIPALVQAAKQMPQGIDPYLPVVMALRETQGGRDLQDPQKSINLGNNNIYNLGGPQPGNTKRFINYPDVETAILGGKNENGGADPGRVSHGFVGTILNDNAYADFRQSGNLKDLFKHYSPTFDDKGNRENGDYGEQINNYQYIRKFFNNG